MRKLLLIDYREKGIAKHLCLEIECNADIEDRVVVAVCHRYIGLIMKWIALRRFSQT